jgi:hypothetical protein
VAIEAATHKIDAHAGATKRKLDAQITRENLTSRARLGDSSLKPGSTRRPLTESKSGALSNLVLRVDSLLKGGLRPDRSKTRAEALTFALPQRYSDAKLRHARTLRRLVRLVFLGSHLF